MRPGSTEDVVVLIPVHDDWEALGLLLPELDRAFSKASATGRVVVIDDGSFTPLPEGALVRPLVHLKRVDVLRLRRNLGHQRAIAVGLCHTLGHSRAGALVVMDGDGEDDPGDVPRLLERLEETGGAACVFAERHRRAEGWLFRVFYALYRGMHRLLTGVPVRIGNFSALPRGLAERLTTVPDLWNHYAASVVKSRLPLATIPTSRRPRLAGASRMNFVGLVAHGLSAMSVFSERMGVRLLIGSSILTILLIGMMFVAILVRLATPFAIPGWATSTVGLLCVLLFQAVILSLVFVFMVLSGREGSSFLPVRDYAHFVEGVTPQWPGRDTNIPEPSSSSSPPPAAGSRISAPG